MGDGPRIDEVERELRLARAREHAASKAEELAMRENLPVHVDPPASPLPYLAATGISTAAMGVGVLALGLPLLPVATWGLTFLACALILKRMDDVPPDHPNAVVRWLSDRVESLRDKFGIELYGVAAMTTFIQLEVGSLSTSAYSLADLLANPIGTAISWFIGELIESIMNLVQAFLWWMPLFGAGWQLGLAVIAAAWAVLWVLDMPEPPPEDYGAKELLELGRELTE